MKVVCQSEKCEHSELVHSGHYIKYPSRFRCSKCGGRVRPNSEGRKQIQSRWKSTNNRNPNE